MPENDTPAAPAKTALNRPMVRIALLLVAAIIGVAVFLGVRPKPPAAAGLPHEIDVAMIKRNEAKARAEAEAALHAQPGGDAELKRQWKLIAERYAQLQRDYEKDLAASRFRDALTPRLLKDFDLAKSVDRVAIAARVVQRYRKRSQELIDTLAKELEQQMAKDSTLTPEQKRQRLAALTPAARQVDEFLRDYIDMSEYVIAEVSHINVALAGARWQVVDDQVKFETETGQNYDYYRRSVADARQFAGEEEQKRKLLEAELRRLGGK